MPEPSSTVRAVRFGTFELDLHSGELRKQGIKVKLQEQPFRVLAILVTHAGEVVTREELRTQLWAEDTFVDFEHSLATAINKIREALGDAVQSPRFIETLPRRGYRFIAPVAPASAAADLPLTVPSVAFAGVTAEAPARIAEARRSKGWWITGAAVFLAVATGITIIISAPKVRERLTTLAGARRRSAAPRIGSIAVLPLDNLSHDPTQEYFADGMTDALITDLAQIHALRVISRNSVMQYKHSSKPTPQIARELNVDAVIEGAVLQIGGRVRISAQLIQASTDRHLWAESYESDMKDVLTLQGEVARAVADEVQVKLEPEERARLATARPVNPQAQDVFLRGRFYYDPYKESRDDLQKGIQYMEEAIRIDPSYAAAYAMLAACYYDSSESREGDVPDGEAAQKAAATALKALELDNSLAEPHVVLGAVHDGYDWDWAAAEHEFERAIDLDPNLVQAHVGYAWHLAFVGRSDDAIQEVNRAIKLDPVSDYALFSQNAILYITRRYNEAIQQSRKWLELFPNGAETYYNLAMEYEAIGAYDQEVAAEQKAMVLGGKSAKDAAALGQAYRSGGIKGVWRWDLESAKREAARGKVREYVFVELYSLLGEKGQALDWLQKLYSKHGQDLIVTTVDPRCDNLHSDPRYQDLLARMNIPSRE